MGFGGLALNDVQYSGNDSFQIGKTVHSRTKSALNPTNLIPSWFDPKDEGVCRVAVSRLAEYCDSDLRMQCKKIADLPPENSPLSPIANLQFSRDNNTLIQDDEDEQNLPFHGLLTAQIIGNNSTAIE